MFKKLLILLFCTLFMTSVIAAVDTIIAVVDSDIVVVADADVDCKKDQIVVSISNEFTNTLKVILWHEGPGDRSLFLHSGDNEEICLANSLWWVNLLVEGTSTYEGYVVPIDRAKTIEIKLDKKGKIFFQWL